MIEEFFELTIVEGVIFSTTSALMMFGAIILVLINRKRFVGYQPKDELNISSPPNNKETKCPFCDEEMNGFELMHYKCKKCNEYFTN